MFDIQSQLTMPMASSDPSLLEVSDRSRRLQDLLVGVCVGFENFSFTLGLIIDLLEHCAPLEFVMQSWWAEEHESEDAGDHVRWCAEIQGL